MALNGKQLNVKLRTGPEVRAQAGMRGGGAAWGLPSSQASLACLTSPGTSLSSSLQWTSCIKAVSQSKNIFPSLTNVSEVVTEQFLCSGMENDDSPCRGKQPFPGSQGARAVVSLWSAHTQSLPSRQENPGERFSLSGDTGFSR